MLGGGTVKELYELKGKGRSMKTRDRRGSRHIEEHGPQVCARARGSEAEAKG